MDGSASGHGNGGGHGIIRIRTDSGETGSARAGDISPARADTRERRRPGLASGLGRQRPADTRSRVVVFGLVWALLAVGFTVSWLLGRDQRTTTDAPAAPSSTHAVDTTTTASPAPSGATAAAPANTPTPGRVHTVVVASRDDVWVRAVADGREIQSGMLRQGDRLDAAGLTVDLVVAKPSSVDVSVDGTVVPATPTMHFGT